MRILFLPLAALTLQGCIVAQAADTAVDVVKLPVNVASKTVDLATTSQKEADRNYGKKVRKAEEAYGKEVRAWEKACARAEKRDEPCPERPAFQMPD